MSRGGVSRDGSLASLGYYAPRLVLFGEPGQSADAYCKFGAPQISVTCARESSIRMYSGGVVGGRKLIQSRSRAKKPVRSRSSAMIPVAIRAPILHDVNQ